MPAFIWSYGRLKSSDLMDGVTDHASSGIMGKVVMACGHKFVLYP